VHLPQEGHIQRFRPYTRIPVMRRFERTSKKLSPQEGSDMRGERRVSQDMPQRGAVRRMLRMVCAMVILCIVVTPCYAGGADQPPAVGKEFPAISLTLPNDAAHRHYLGVTRGEKSITVPDIKADLAIVEVLSMYCPHCQAEAPKMNELYARIESDAALRGRIKILGIAAGNSPYEADVFRKKYRVSFPIFADGDFSIHKALGDVRTPYFIGIRIEKGNTRVFYSKLGAFETVNEFLDMMIRESGLNGKESAK